MPTTTRPANRQILSAVGHLAWTTAIVIGAPVALWRFFGWPLPAEMPDLGEVASTPLQLVDPVVILNTFVCLAWLCWAILMVYVALDVIDTARGVGQRLHRVGPFGTIAAKLVGSVVLLASLVRPTVSFAAPVAPTPVVHLIDAPAPSAPVPPPNPGGGSTAITSPTDPSVVAPAPAPQQPTYVVQRGDSLWTIAETHLGSGFRWTEIHGLNRTTIANPDIICAGWQLTLPADALMPLPAPTTEPTPTDTNGPATPEPPVAADDTNVDEPLAEPAGGAAPSTTSTTVEADQDAGARVEAPAAHTTPAVREADTGSTHSEQWMPALAATVPGITGATVLATGVLLLLRRRQRRAPGPLPRRHVTPLERSLVAAADLPLVRWVGQELAILGELIAGRRHPANPVAVEFSETTGIEILWDQPFPDAPVPWEAMPGSWSWRTTYDPDAPVPVAERPSPIPGLVTVGHRDGRQLMLNLEALGTVSITGDQKAVEGIVRSMLLELATCDEITDATVAVTDDVAMRLGVAGAGAEVLTANQAVESLADARRCAEDLLEDLNTSTTFGYRTYSSPVLPLPVTVVTAAADAPVVAEVSESLAPNRGCALILLGESGLASAGIHIAPNGKATVRPLDLNFAAAHLPPSSKAAICDLLADTSEQAEVHTGGSIHPWWIDEPDIDDSPNAQAPENDAAGDQRVEECEAVIDLTGDGYVAAPVPAARPESPRMLVKVLGTPRLVDGPSLGRREVNVVVFVACSPRPVSHEHIQDAIWGGSAISTKSVFNLIAKARTALGKWDDEPVLSTAKRPHNTIAIHPDVRTDLDLLRDFVAAAEAAPSREALALLVEALELVDGPPFDADGYDWAITCQLVSEAEHLIERAATMAAELALETGDVRRAQWAVIIGLRALPGDERLYQARIRVELAAGDHTAVRRTYNELAECLEHYGDSPSEMTEALMDGLTAQLPKNRSSLHQGGQVSQ